MQSIFHCRFRHAPKEYLKAINSAKTGYGQENTFAVNTCRTTSCSTIALVKTFQLIKGFMK